MVAMKIRHEVTIKRSFSNDDTINALLIPQLFEASDNLSFN